MIIRNDDVSANSSGLKFFYDTLTRLFPESTIYSCTTVFSKNGGKFKQSVYPDLPLKEQELDYFFDVDGVKSDYWCVELEYPNLKLASHGLWHFDHTKVDSQLKKASIISSCRLLKTDIFVPPFNRWDEEMDLICLSNNIQMIKSNEAGWKSFEHNKFDPSHELWYFHSWMWTLEKFKEYIGV